MPNRGSIARLAERLGHFVKIAERLGHFVKIMDLDQVVVARVLGTSPKTVSRWVRAQASPRREARERLLEFLAVLERLSAVLRPEPAHDWLFTPNHSWATTSPPTSFATGSSGRSWARSTRWARASSCEAMPDPALVERVDALGSIEFEGEGYRHLGPHYPPRSGEGARVSGGRWNPPDSFPVLYVGLDIPTIVAEFYRSAARQALPPEDLRPRRVYHLDTHTDRPENHL